MSSQNRISRTKGKELAASPELQELSALALKHPRSGSYGAGLLDRMFAGVTTMPASSIRKYVDSVRARNPEASPERVVEILSSQFRTLLQTTGGAVGATAAVPTIGTATALVLTGADLAAFFTASALYSLAVAEVHGISTDDPERRKALVLASVLGERGAQTVAGLGNVPVSRWGTALMTSMPKSTISQVNGVLTSRFLKRKLAAHSSVALGRFAPFGIGAVIGLMGGRALAYTVILQTNKAFGQPPKAFPEPIIEVHPDREG